MGSPGEKPFAIPSTSTKRNPRESAKSPQESRKNPQMKEPECHRKRSFSAGSGSRFGGSWGIHAGPGPGMVPGPAARRPAREKGLAGPGIHSGPRPGIIPSRARHGSAGVRGPGAGPGSMPGPGPECDALCSHGPRHSKDSERSNIGPAVICVHPKPPLKPPATARTPSPGCCTSFSPCFGASPGWLPHTASPGWLWSA